MYYTCDRFPSVLVEQLLDAHCLDNCADELANTCAMWDITFDHKVSGLDLDLLICCVAIKQTGH